MKIEVEKNGFKVRTFSAGDGMLVRWSDSLQQWRARSPARRKLAHAASWYLDAEARARRPLYGLQSLAIFAERLLYEAMRRHDVNGREVASAQRAFVTVQRKMAQMKYRHCSHVAEMRYLRSSVRRCAELCAKAYRIVNGREATSA